MSHSSLQRTPLRRLPGILFVSLFVAVTAAPAMAGDTPFLGDVVCYAFNFCPRGWARCDGQLLPIAQNQALFALLGTQYGGNGQTTFALPDLRGRTVVDQGPQAYAASVGASGGSDQTGLITANLPPHTHQVPAFPREGGTTVPGGTVWAKSGNGSPVYGAAPDTTMSPAAVSTTGGSTPYGSQQPYLVTTCCIALQGIFPSRN